MTSGKKTAVITGGAGFLGSHLCKQLLDRDYRVVCVDNLVSGSLSNIEPFGGDKNFTFLNKDITDILEISEKVDEVYNLACPASPVDYRYLPIETLLTCSLGVRNVLDLAVKNKALFLHTSTSEVYGDPLEHPQKETYFGNVNPIGERSCYDEGKRFAESLIVNYGEKFGLKYRIARLFNTYGPNMRENDGRVVSNFINQAIKGENITIYGDGEQTRSFCYVSDTISGLITLMGSGHKGPMNIGNPDERSIKDLANIVLETSKSHSKIIYKDYYTKDDPKRRRPDITLAKKLLGWGPKINLEEGLKHTYEYFKSKV